MQQHVLLNHRDHADLRIVDDFTTEFETGVNFSMVFTTEFRDIQSEFPIFFQKNPKTGAFYAVALFGLEPGENLFLNKDGWDGDYVPMMLQKQPFFIGNAKTKVTQEKESKDETSMVVTMDPASPRISKTDGHKLFNPDGSVTEFLTKKMDVLERVHQGNQHTEDFVAALVEHELLEQFVLELNLHDGSTKQMLGFYTVKEEAVQALKGDVLEQFSEKGFLMPLFMVLASHANVRELIRRKTGF